LGKTLALAEVLADAVDIVCGRRAGADCQYQTVAEESSDAWSLTIDYRTDLAHVFAEA